MTMGLVKHILKTSEGAFGVGDQVAAGMSVQSLVQKKTQLLHEEEAMLAQFMGKDATCAADSALQSLAKARVKDISKQLRVLSTWSRQHSSQQLAVPTEISFSRPSSAYRSVVSHVSAPPLQAQAPGYVKMGSPVGLSSFNGGFGAMALENSAQVQHSWPAVASIVMTPWGAALSPLPPLANAGESPSQQHDAAQRIVKHDVLNGDQSARRKDAETILLQQKQLERQQQLLDDLILLQQKNQQPTNQNTNQRVEYQQQHQASQPPLAAQGASQLVAERVAQLEESARRPQHQPSASHPRAPLQRSRDHAVSMTVRPSKTAVVAPTRECNQGVMVGNGIYRDERGMLRNGGPQVLLNWDAAAALCRHLDAVPHLLRLSQTCVFFKRVCQLTPSLWHTVDLTPVGSYDVIMRSSFETQMTTANISTLLSQRCTDGDLLAFRASSVQTVTDELMPLLAKKSHNLLEIDIGWHNDAGPAVTDAGVITVLKHAQQLQVFKAAWVGTLTDASLLALSTYCRHVTHIDVSGVAGVSDVGITSICESSIGPQITFFSVYGCERLTDSSLLRLTRRCSSLLDVNVGGCSRMGGDAFVLLCSACCHLQNLNASGLFRINDSHIFLASRSLLQLHTLSLAFCRNVGADALSALTSNHPPFTLEPHLINDRGNEVCSTITVPPHSLSHLPLVPAIRIITLLNRRRCSRRSRAPTIPCSARTRSHASRWSPC